MTFVKNYFGFYRGTYISLIQNESYQKSPGKNEWYQQSPEKMKSKVEHKRQY